MFAKLKALTGRVLKALLEMFSGRGLTRDGNSHDNLATGRIGALGACLLDSAVLRGVPVSRD